MTIRMLVDALHEEETRVVIADDRQILDFDIESSTKRQVKGNIYLAKVTRVEPSLQAAFVEYGAGRQGFLPFSEIHPDYYQIPMADRKELLAAQAAERAAEQKAAEAEIDVQAITTIPAEAVENNDEVIDITSIAEPEVTEAADELPTIEDEKIVEFNEEKTMEDVGGDDPIDIRPRRSSIRRYKIQEVIKKNQVMLIQVIKEERGNKGAAVTTYISLPGRYCVLMPNTSNGGGVSRKINDAKERRKLKELLEGLDLNDGMSLIIRTAGLGHSKADIARDYSYLIRLWNKIRELTLTSSAPALVYEEGNVLKRSIRDFFNDDVDELVVAGDKAFDVAQEFVKMLLPAQIDKVVKHTDILPVFHKYGVERYLSSMYDETVVMRSGGYLVINSTEALISIDINSGRATGERNVEDTATRINIEAANEIARQLRLRDLAGLIVIDFIDMMDSRHRRSVERALKDALRADRAKIQVGRISPFGLLEMSRQRLRPSINEIQMIDCPTCKGAGHIRSFDSAMLQLIRAIESEIAFAEYDNFDTTKVFVGASSELAVHFLNNKRRRISEIEDEYNLEIIVSVQHMPPSQFTVQLEDFNGARTKLVSSEDRDSRLPQSREKGGKSKRDRKNKGKQRNEQRYEQRQSSGNIAEVEAPEFAADEQISDTNAEPNSAETPEADYNENEGNQNSGRRGGRYNRRGNRRNRGGKDDRGYNNKRNADVIEGEEVKQYQPPENTQSHSHAEVYELDRKLANPQLDEYPPHSESVMEAEQEDANRPKRGGWWKKIIE